MAALNRMQIIGNLGADPQEGQIEKSGTPTSRFSVAVTNRFTRDGETVENTDWFQVQAYDGLARSSNEFLKKGRQVYVEGPLQVQRYTDKESGQEKTAVRIIARSIIFLGKKETDSGELVGAGAKTEEEMPF